MAIAMVAIYAVLMLTACPAAKTIQTAKDASKKLATAANSGVEITRTLYRDGLITTNQKDVVAKGFIALANAGVAFDVAVANAEKQFGPGVPGSEIEKLFATFDSSVVAQFVEVIKSVKLVKGASAFADVIELLKTAVLAIAKAFSKTKVVAAKLAEV